MLTVGRTYMKKLIAAIRNFANASKMVKQTFTHSLPGATTRLADSRSRLQPSLTLVLILQFLTPSLSASLTAPGLYNDRTFQVPILKHRQARFRFTLQRLILWVFVTNIFTGVGRQPASQPPTWRTRVPLLVWAITFDLSGKEDPTSSKLPPA